MSGPPRLSLILNSYNQPEYLERVLAAITRQRSAPDEVLLADDGSEPPTGEVLNRWAAGRPFRAQHVWQAHEGFRRARILNQAIAWAQGDYLVFLDGDTVPHPEFVSDHRRLLRRGGFIQGHRALVQQRGSGWFGLGGWRSDRRRALWRGQLKGWQHAFRWPRPLTRARSDLRGIRGCNLGIWRDDLVRVNGYNEAFVGWGREDSELAVRLLKAGVGRWDVRGWAVCCHLWHPPASRAGLPANDALLEAARNSADPACALGLNQYLRPPPNPRVTQGERPHQQHPA